MKAWKDLTTLGCFITETIEEAIELAILNQSPSDNRPIRVMSVGDEPLGSVKVIGGRFQTDGSRVIVMLMGNQMTFAIDTGYDRVRFAKGIYRDDMSYLDIMSGKIAPPPLAEYQYLSPMSINRLRDIRADARWGCCFIDKQWMVSFDDEEDYLAYQLGV